jgi:glutamine---fructose-6-phosphate transaminase (isomerizing)
MCGIVGYVGPREATDVIVRGLELLEYRGYDSAGIAILEDAEFQMRRSVGKLVNLRRRLHAEPTIGHQGIATLAGPLTAQLPKPMPTPTAIAVAVW